MARPKVHDEALRARLLTVASQVIAEAGTAAITVRDVAARAQTSASAVYSLFGGRDELVRAVGDEAFARFGAALAAVAPTGSPRGDLLALGLAYRAHAVTEPQFYRVMFATAGAGARDGTRGAATQAATFRVLRAAVARALPDASDAGIERAAVGLWGAVHGLVLLELDGLLPWGATEAPAAYESALRGLDPAAIAYG